MLYFFGYPGSYLLQLSSLVGMHSCITASKASANEVHSSSTDLSVWLERNLSWKAFIIVLSFTQSAFANKWTSRFFLFLKNRFYETLSRDQIVVSQTREDIDPLYQSGVGGEEEVQGIVLSGWLCHHLTKAKVLDQV